MLSAHKHHQLTTLSMIKYTKSEEKNIFLNFFYTLKNLFIQLLTKNTNDGVGVKRLTFICDNIAGICPFRAPTKHIRDDVIMCTLKPPNAEIATITGIIHLNPFDNILSPNV